ncbi:helix-turn-helix domain-containing protein [Labedaea rhizosphaerae]|uniref:Helix-turn-helix protein n=1 Tax=Labedaea rhizosphaerae TaxID=598644 RepID=A0A4R6SJ99_LABRH|nr:helix-turn-helix transcriptional regulator [Labedaea rhizosphaerae]TDQ04109.1 helix-turn-helix protein [Labedaea rhizosphaerae]
MTQKKPPLRRRRLGRRLRALRESAGLTLDEAARSLDMSRTSLFRIESAETKANVHVVRSMMDLYDHYEEGLLQAVRDAAEPSWFITYGVQDMGYTDAETEASRVWIYPGMQLPGLLHVENYIRAQLAHASRRRSAKQVENQVAVRHIRQRRLTSLDNPLDLVAVIDEAALTREIGGPLVLREQLDHLVMMAELPSVTLHVLPQRTCPVNALDGSFALLGFPNPDEPDLLYHEYVTGALHIEDEEEVRAARLRFDSLRGEALNQADSVALIEQHAIELPASS